MHCVSACSLINHNIVLLLYSIEHHKDEFVRRKMDSSINFHQIKEILAVAIQTILDIPVFTLTRFTNNTYAYATHMHCDVSS